MNLFDLPIAHEKAFLVLCTRRNGTTAIVGQAKTINEAVTQRDAYLIKMVEEGFTYRRTAQGDRLLVQRRLLARSIQLRVTITINATALLN